jgi:micrococcal nuclease
VDVIDGDTLKVRLSSGARRAVRIIGIDTPESRKPGVPVECGAKSATKHMTRLAFRERRGRSVGQRVRLTTDPTQDRTDRYGRLLAYVDRRSDGKDLGRSMVAAGWAIAYVYDGTAFERFALYDGAQTRARNSNRGVWAACGGDFHSEQ